MPGPRPSPKGKQAPAEARRDRRRKARRRRAFLLWPQGGETCFCAPRPRVHGGIGLPLASAACFRAKWRGVFSEENTLPQAFHTPAGDVETGFVRQQSSQPYYWGSRFAAVCGNCQLPRRGMMRRGGLGPAAAPGGGSGGFPHKSKTSAEALAEVLP